MTKDQITTYEYCKNHLSFIEGAKQKLPFSRQKYGCGAGRPNIEYSLEKIHNKMYEDISNAIREAEEKVNNIIEKT